MDGPEVETTLVDLSSASLDEVHRDFASLQGAVDLLLSQIERPRYNIGNTGPPGRAD
ncbi:hypothetical protein GCM10009557_36900 [Virgisporangium ochraceum]|uniref:Uncharacterized protein n=1 Tax=Virgisporangium ochraceum TaxID=65505 RepID=A0A8J4ECX8_9ACTN|nr:hypothetical protein [Virgisporangium ochraceum]GIJ69988.1 hypothetical protein Voc01_049050 [Virgisporangium ochraceum]